MKPIEEKELQTKSIRYDQVIMCPKCFHGEYVEITETVKVRPKNAKLFVHYLDDIAIYRSDMSMVCGKCGWKSDRASLIDSEIFPVIKVLNEKGYYTENCCSGHVFEYDGTMSYAYISFGPMPKIIKQSKFYENISKNIPSSWYLDENEWCEPWCCALRVDEKVQLNDPEKKYLKDILSWAQQLPKFEW